MDDGDEVIYSERIKKLEAAEKRYKSKMNNVDEDSQEAEELEDLEKEAENDEEEVNDKSKPDEDEEDNQPKFEHKNWVINTGEHIELDSSSSGGESRNSNLKLKVPSMIWSRLYKFQKTGLKWMWELHVQRCGGILGDEMGLGKTIQTIAYLAALSYTTTTSRLLRSNGGLGPILIVTPVTVMAQWVREFHEWWPYFRVNVLHDIGTYQEVGSKTRLIEKTFNCNGVLITTFSSLLIYDKVTLLTSI